MQKTLPATQNTCGGIMPVLVALVALVSFPAPSARAEEPAEKPEKIKLSALEPLVRKHATRVQPKLDPGTTFKIEEHPVPGLEKALNLQLFFVRYLSSDGQQFNEALFIYRDGTLTPFASAFGGFGLMSAVVVGDALYYSYSFGSGIHRSHVSVLSLDGDDIRILDSGGFEGIDLFVQVEGSDVRVESGKFGSFNSWEEGKKFGSVKTDSKSLTIMDAAGADVPPDFPPHGERKTKPSGKKASAGSGPGQGTEGD